MNFNRNTEKSFIFKLIAWLILRIMVVTKSKPSNLSIKSRSLIRDFIIFVDDLFIFCRARQFSISYNGCNRHSVHIYQLYINYILIIC